MSDPQQVATVDFVDIDSGSDAFVAIRASSDVVVLSISIRVDGDLLVAMNYSDFERLLEALHLAATIAEPTESSSTSVHDS